MGVGLAADRLPMILGCDGAGVTTDGREVIIHAVVASEGWQGDETLDPARTLVFVEVKTSRTPRFGDPVEWVDARKQQHLIKAAECYLQNHHCGECRCRFDVVAVTYEADGAVCRHIEDAF